MPTLNLSVVALSIAVTAGLTWILMRINPRPPTEQKADRDGGGGDGGGD